ncbi:hypothetical protein GCM10010401_05080 [Rarobacter faecitabidus]|uniref:Uncharacterized protein n=1 Tax=Rarobacter faecitabidus TaxID=13243 RepID=A0A542ZTY0_RARFA|nr:hypothetical protein [Rarobacter faecitabidus]TQL63739.1 hypothetical protein FB461_0212 [Rarobacter faecitabidus]
MHDVTETARAVIDEVAAAELPEDWALVLQAAPLHPRGGGPAHGLSVELLPPGRHDLADAVPHPVDAVDLCGTGLELIPDRGAKDWSRPLGEWTKESLWAELREGIDLARYVWAETGDVSTE